MLHIYIGEKADSTGMAMPKRFDNLFEDSWTSDEFAKRAIKTIDKSEVLYPKIINSPVLGYITPRQLSGGVKSLLIMKNDKEMRDKYFDGALFGDNVLPFILELSEEREVYMTDDHLFVWPNNLNNHKIHIVNDDSYVSTNKEYFNKYMEISHQ